MTDKQAQIRNKFLKRFAVLSSSAVLVSLTNGFDAAHANQSQAANEPFDLEQCRVIKVTEIKIKADTIVEIAQVTEGEKYVYVAPAPPPEPDPRGHAMVYGPRPVPPSSDNSSNTVRTVRTLYGPPSVVG